MQVRNSAAYCTCRLSCTVSRIANPVMAMQIAPMINKKRCLAQSEKTATTMENPNDTTQGGTERSWVVMGSYL